MSRSGYSYELDDLELGRWRGQVMSAIRGKRGQKLLRDLITALEAMPDKVLIPHDLEDESGDVCALGACARYRGISIAEVDPGEPEEVAALFDIAPQLAQEIVFENDEQCAADTPEQRWKYMRAWAEKMLVSQ